MLYKDWLLCRNQSVYDYRGMRFTIILPSTNLKVNIRARLYMGRSSHSILEYIRYFLPAIHGFKVNISDSSDGKHGKAGLVSPA